MTDTRELPDFPVDDATLIAIESSLEGCLSFDRPAHAKEWDEGPWYKGGPYSYSELICFLSGAMFEDPDTVDLNKLERDDPAYHCAPVNFDTRPTYTTDDVIRALIKEIQRLRGGT